MAQRRPDAHTRERAPSWSRFLLLTAGVLVVALTGYAGYELYPRFDLPALEGASLLVLAAGAGVASFFAPCSFPLLVTGGVAAAATPSGSPRS